MYMSQHELMDHYRSPRNYGLCDTADFVSREHNPSCGDLVTVSGRFDEHYSLVAVGFEAKGCVISVATASMFLQFCLGKSYTDLTELDTSIVLKLMGIEIGPTRLRCALLPYQALMQGLSQYHKNKVF